MNFCCFSLFTYFYQTNFQIHTLYCLVAFLTVKGNQVVSALVLIWLKYFIFSVHYYIKSCTHKSLFTLYHFVHLFQLFQVIGLIFGKIWGRWQKQWGKDIIFECNTWISYFLVIITMKPLIIFTIFSDYIYLFVLKSYDILCS